MSWIFSAIPYVLAGGTILLGFFTILKEWDEYEKKPWLKTLVIIVLMIVGALTFVSLHIDSQEKKRAQGEAEAAGEAQSKNTKLFLDSLHQMSGEVSDLKTEVKTEALQKKLEGVQAELVKTQKAMQPGPKAELDFSFAPLPFSPVGQPLKPPVKEVTLPLATDGTVHVEFNLVNMTTVDAVEADVIIQICDDCKFAKEPQGLTKLPGGRETERVVFLSDLHAMEGYKTISLDVIPPLVQQFPVGVVFRCRTCVLKIGAITGTVHIAGR